MKNKKIKPRKVTAYMVWSYERKDLGDLVFKSKAKALAFIKEIAKDSVPFVQKKFLEMVKENYRIIPCEIIIKKNNEQKKAMV